MIYNAVSIFSLIENVQWIDFNFSGSTYHVTRTDVEQNYPNYGKITAGGQIDKEKFNQYAEQKMNDSLFIEEIFPALFRTAAF